MTTSVLKSTAPLAAELCVKRRNGEVVKLNSISFAAHFLQDEFDTPSLLWQVAASNLETAHRLPDRIPTATEALRLLLDSEGRMIDFTPVPNAGFVRLF
ncbi:hypothetical protein [Bradyrhizobium sp. SZCCHNRI2049]|uniref:hypothetical protein n=1 Tax=Bradyrhizobium sp. SZCCHNRI2049 TaxID=3057287 RepID=UPI002915F993|nr:hypothetical protein [Bradyrhizobium sp. SZCCHNRI2049]